jgi:hypothetical protein
MKKPALALALGLLLAAAAAAQAPLQLDVRAKANGRRLVAATFKGTLAPGTARLVGTVLNEFGGETALVGLRFDYRTSQPVALDEIIERIEVTIEDKTGAQFAKSTIEPDLINLNPNRVPLYYATTLYVPEDARTAGYFVRVKVLGNYE